MADEGSSKSPPSDGDGKTDCQHRLWIGNLDKRLSEYNLLKILQKFGEIKYFEYLFHTQGPMKGEPRGFCFVEYANKEEAEKALEGLKGKMVLSRSLLVHWAKEDQSKEVTKEKKIKKSEDSTTSSKGPLASVSKESKIQAIEAKLRLMESSNYTDDTSRSRNKHPLLEESERNKTKPYSYKTHSRFKYTDRKNVKKPR